MTSCQVCYEEYSNDSTLTCARKLNCGHFLCRKCLQNDFVDDSYCCPECFTILEGSTIDVISISISTEEIQQQNQSAIIPTEYIDDDNNTSGEFEDEEDDGSNHNNINNPIDSYFQRGICSYPGCQNREIEGNLCLRHGDRQGDFSEADRIASDLRNAKFHMKTNEANIIEPTVCLDLQPDDLRERFSMQKRIELGEAMELIDRARDVMATEPNIISLQAPLLAVGDIHGQYFDLLNMIEQGGIPGVEEQYLFLGDYVDRGSFSCEVMFFLLSLKVAYPTKVWLLRGNHECATVSGHFGFKKECKMKYGMNVYYKFLLLFQSMPLAAVISTSYGDVFACHGGISPSFQTLDEIEKLNRFVEPETDPALLDILWSDPVSDEEVDGMSDDQFQEFLNLDWKTNTSRGCSYTYGYKAIRRFLDTNNLVCIVRAHEVQEDGYKKHFDPSVVEERIKRLIAKRAQGNQLYSTKVCFHFLHYAYMSSTYLLSSIIYDYNSYRWIKWQR